MTKAAVNGRGLLPALRADPLNRGDDQRNGTEGFGARSDLLRGGAAQSPAFETLQRPEQVFEELRAERALPLLRLPFDAFRF